MLRRLDRLQSRYLKSSCKDFLRCTRFGRELAEVLFEGHQKRFSRRDKMFASNAMSNKMSVTKRPQHTFRSGWCA